MRKYLAPWSRDCALETEPIPVGARTIADFARPRCRFALLIWPAWSDRHKIRRTPLAFAGLNQRPDSPRSGAARTGAGRPRLDPGIPGFSVDHNAFAVNDVLALADHDIAA